MRTPSRARDAAAFLCAVNALALGVACGSSPPGTGPTSEAGSMGDTGPGTDAGDGPLERDGGRVADSGRDGSASRADAATSTTGAVKWNPGHYMASSGILYPGDTLMNSDFLPYELEAIKGHDEIVGYRLLITWASLESSYGVYDFDQITSILTYLKTQLGAPRHLVVVVLPGSFTSTAPGTHDYSVLPEYILTSSQYGPSPVSGSYGWWGGTGNGNTYAAALHRLPASSTEESVNDRWIKLHQALGKAFNAEPYFEAIMFQEDSWIIGASDSNGDPTWNQDDYVTNIESLLTSTVAAFPNTNVIEENSYLATATPAQELEQWMIEHRVAPGQADSYGETYFVAHDGVPNGWGMAAYFGITSTSAGSTYSGPDYRPTTPSLVDVEGPDLGAYGRTGYTPQDICNALNEYYHSSHAFWSYLPSSSSSPVASQWTNLVATLSSCPLVNTEYPSNYPK